MTANHNDDVLGDIAGHATMALRAAVAAGSHAGTVLAQRREQRARTATADATRQTTLAEQRADALTRVRDLTQPATTPAGPAAAPVPGRGGPLPTGRPRVERPVAAVAQPAVIARPLEVGRT